MGFNNTFLKFWVCICSFMLKFVLSFHGCCLGWIREEKLRDGNLFMIVLLSYCCYVLLCDQNERKTIQNVEAKILLVLVVSFNNLRKATVMVRNCMLTIFKRRSQIFKYGSRPPGRFAFYHQCPFNSKSWWFSILTVSLLTETD